MPSALDQIQLGAGNLRRQHPRRRHMIAGAAFVGIPAADDDFLAQANKLKLDITYVSGEENEKWVDEVLSLSPKMKEELKYLSPVQ